MEHLAGLPAAKRGTVSGIKPARGDLILAATAVLETALEQGGFEALEATEAGLREGASSRPCWTASSRRSCPTSGARRY